MARDQMRRSEVILVRPFGPTIAVLAGMALLPTPGHSASRECIVADTANPVVLATSSAMEIGDAPVRVIFSPAQPAPLVARIAALPPDQQIYLVLTDLRARAQSGRLYRVYFGMPAGAAPEDTYAVDAFTFFDLQIPSLSFDLTATIERLKAQQRLVGEPSVTIIPQPLSKNRPPAKNEQPTVSIGRIEMVLQCRGN